MPEELKIRDFAIVKGGKRLPKGHKYSQVPTKFPYIRVKDFDQYSIESQNLRFITQETYNAISRYTISSEDVYISIAGTIGKVGCIPELLNGANLTENAAKITSIRGVHNRYLVFFLSSIQGQRQISDYTKATSQPKLALYRIESIDVPIFPLPEQRAIVAKLEALFSELDAGVASLQKAQEQLKVYRQAVLKKAFEGELTREWREQQTDLPTAEELLEQIQAERERYYEQQLVEWEEAVQEWEAEGKMGKKPRKPAIDKVESQMISVDSSNDSPYLWYLTKMLYVADITGGLTKNSKRKGFPLSYPYLRVANVYANELKLDEIQTIGVKKEELERVLLKKGDLLIVEGNGSPDQIGRVSVWNAAIESCVHQNHLIKARPFSKVISKFILYWLLSPKGRDEIRMVSSSTSGLYTLSLSKVKQLTLPICSAQEQHQIVQEIESRLSVCEQLEKDITANLQRAERLRQSILQRAFAGELLTEEELAACRAEADWEPAEKLLERIKQASKK